MNTRPRVYAAAVTPRRLGMQDINLGAVWDLIDLLSSRGLDGIVLFGSGSDCRHFTPQEQLRLVGLAVRRSRLPLVLKISHPNMDGAVELADGAQAAGMSGVLLSPPESCLGDPALMEEFVLRFHHLVQPRMPVWLDECSIGTRTRIPPPRLHALFQDGKLTGVRNSFASPEHAPPLPPASGFERVAGSDPSLFAALDGGASALMLPLACALPELVVALSQSSGTTREALRQRYCEIVQWIVQFPEPVIVREIIGLRGVKTGPHEIPFDRAREAKLADFRTWFAAWLPTLEKECRIA